MRIGIDARLFGTKHGGIGRYTEKLLKELELIDTTNEYFVFLDNSGINDYKPTKQNFKKIKANFRVYSLNEQLIFPLLLNKYHLDLVHFTHFNVPLLYGGKFVVTIHDLIISHYPNHRATTLNPILYKIKLFIYKLVITNSIRRAKKIISVSDFTKKDIINLFKIDSNKIQTIYEGVDLPIISKVDTKNILNRLKLSGDFLLYVGSAYPHKNLEKLLEAFVIIANNHSSLKLVLVGKINYFYKLLQDKVKKIITASNNFLSENLKERIIFTDYLNDEDLAVLYRQAKLYIFPSLIEGFGLPPLEAQSYDLPVVSSNRSCLPEILGDSAVYFDPENINDMVEKIELMLSNDILRQQKIIAGRANFKKYSWKKMAQEIIRIYQEK